MWRLRRPYKGGVSKNAHYIYYIYYITPDFRVTVPTKVGVQFL